MEKIADIKVFNDTFIDMATNGQTKEAGVSAQQFTRNKLREESFWEKVLTPIDIANDELDKTQNPEFHVKWCDREPDLAPAVTIPLGVVPDGYQFAGTRYPVYFSRMTSPLFMKDIDKLRGYTYDIRGIMLENSTKDIAAEIDTKAIEKVNAVIGLRDTVNALNAMSLPQWAAISGGLNRATLVEAFKVITRLKVPFGPMQPDGNATRGVMLCNNVTGMDLLKIERTEAGGDVSEKMFLDGTPPPTILGIKTIFTIKRDLVPDGTVYLFSSEEFLGKYFRLQPLTVYLKNEAFFLSFFQYLNLGISIGNVRGCVRVDFT